MRGVKEVLLGCGLGNLGIVLISNLMLIIFVMVYVKRGTGEHDADNMAKYMPIEISRVRASQQEVTSTLKRGWKDRALHRCDRCGHCVTFEQ